MSVLKAGSDDAICSIQLLSNSLIHELLLSTQYNKYKRIVRNKSRRVNQPLLSYFSSKRLANVCLIFLSHLEGKIQMRKFKIKTKVYHLELYLSLDQICQWR